MGQQWWLGIPPASPSIIPPMGDAARTESSHLAGLGIYYRGQESRTATRREERNNKEKGGGVRKMEVDPCFALGYMCGRRVQTKTGRGELLMKK